MRLSFGKKCIKTNCACEFALAESSTLPAQVGPFTYCSSYVPSADFKVAAQYLLGSDEWKDKWSIYKRSDETKGSF